MVQNLELKACWQRTAAETRFDFLMWAKGNFSAEAVRGCGQGREAFQESKAVNHDVRDPNARASVMMESYHGLWGLRLGVLRDYCSDPSPHCQPSTKELLRASVAKF